MIEPMDVALRSVRGATLANDAACEGEREAARVLSAVTIAL